MRQVINVDSYLKEIKCFNVNENVFYRGQSDHTYKNISTSISRDEGYIENESLLIKEILQTKEGDFKEFSSPIEYLSKMQHYGFPTRLIDITSSPIIALYFAVENVDNLKDGEVFIFNNESFELNSKEANIVSLLSMINSYNIKYIIDMYFNVYGEMITEEEILKFANKNIYIKGFGKLKKTNERLFAQEGTFIICGNKIINKTITKQLLCIKKEEAKKIIRIPFEYKKSIKDELDKMYKINEAFIYPELPSYANYIKNKYKKEEVDLVNTYKVVKCEDSSIIGAKRSSIYIVVEKKINIYQIKKIIKSVIADKRGSLDVIWIYVTLSEEDMAIYNYIVRAVWINENLDERWRPNHLKELDEDGISWEFSDEFLIVNDYYNKNIFKNDKYLFLCNDDVFRRIKEIYVILEKVFNDDLSEFEIALDIYKAEIREIYLKVGNFGCSRDMQFSKYLHLYQELVVSMDNIPVYLEKRNLNCNVNKYMINKYFKKIKDIIIKIEFQRVDWEEKLNIIYETI